MLNGAKMVIMGLGLIQGETRLIMEGKGLIIETHIGRSRSNHNGNKGEQLENLEL